MENEFNVLSSKMFRKTKNKKWCVKLHRHNESTRRNSFINVNY